MPWRRSNFLTLVKRKRWPSSCSMRSRCSTHRAHDSPRGRWGKERRIWNARYSRVMTTAISLAVWEIVDIASQFIIALLFSTFRQGATD